MHLLTDRTAKDKRLLSLQSLLLPADHRENSRTNAPLLTAKHCSGTLEGGGTSSVTLNLSLSTLYHCYLFRCFLFFQLHFSYTFHKGFFYSTPYITVSFYRLEFFFFLHFVFCYSLLFFSIMDIYVAFLFWLAVAIVGGKKKHLRHLNFVTSSHTPRNAAFISFLFLKKNLLLSVLFPTVQIYVYMKEILFGGQFKLRY